MSKSPSRPVPLGAMAAGFGLSLVSSAWAQTAPAPEAKVAETPLPEVSVTATDRRPAAKQTYQAGSTSIGKGKQALRDIPQSVTVVTEKLITDRNLDTVKEALHQTSGITFMAAEGGEEDIRLRGFSLAGTGDIFVDGVRDPAFYERDTFNLDRLELLRGSASMLFGRGSTGGAVNQVSKAPFLQDSNEATATLGSFQYRRLTVDMNKKTGDDAALRVNAMVTKADNNGAGSSIDKRGVALAYRWGIGKKDEFLVDLYHLNNENGINYGLPWIRPTQTGSSKDATLLPGQKAKNYYGAASDYNDGSATWGTFSHLHRFTGTTELKTTVRKGVFTRDQHASTIRLPATRIGNGTFSSGLDTYNNDTVFSRGSQVKIQDLDSLYVQSDLSAKFDTGRFKHALLTGVDFTREEKHVTGVLNQNGVTKPSTKVGTPDDGGWTDESKRTYGETSNFTAKGLGAYIQDLVQVAPHWKVLGGVRYDHLEGTFRTIDVTTRAVTPYKQTISEWSNRFGVLFQPTALHSFHFSYGTSFNTSGDTYSYAYGGNNDTAIKKAINTPPESSENAELGAKLDSADGAMTTRLAAFWSVKKHERNTDGPSAADGGFELSGKRHTAGFEVDWTGRITDQWEVYVSYTWMPIAEVDEASSTRNFGNRKGERPGLTPKHSGTVWSTYQVLPALRVGGGVNFRSKQSPADITYNPDNNTTATWYAPGFATVDLMAEYKINDRYTVKGNVINVGDKYYADSLYRGHYVPGVGRNIQVSLNAKF